MATHTPNLNLYMPDSTDDFGEFRAEHNDNMVKIDNAIGGGGGSGGHTIIDENGNSLPQESGLQFTGGVTVTDDNVNGKTVVDITGGGGNVYGAFIDTNRIIQAQTAIPANTTATYTATEDCYLLTILRKNGDNASLVYVDGEQIGGIYTSTGYTTDLQGFFIKKGQVVTITATSESHYTVYGLTQGTNGIFTPIIYSDTERVVGVWRDNKPLYARSFHYSFTASSNDYSYDIETLSSNIVVQKIETDRFSRDGVTFNEVIYPPNTIFFRYGVDESTHKLGVRVWNSNTNVIDGTVTLLYTKTTDVAGSGTWNTDGVPTVHYSTTEQVIGTWIDGKPLYEISFEYHGNINANATTVIADVASLNIDDFVSGVGTGYEAGWGWGQLPANGSFIRYDTTTNKLQVQTASFALANTTAYFTIRYTKTTD